MDFTPEWIVKLLQGMGIAGGIIFVLLTMLSGAIATIVYLLRHSSKVYGYRLAERDKLNEALSKSADVLKDMLQVTEERNDLTAEQAKLLNTQTQAFETLRVTIVAQFSKLEQNHAVTMDAYKISRDVIGSLSDGLRTIHQMIVENRGNNAELVNGVRVLIQDSRNAIEGHIQNRVGAVESEMRRLNNTLSNDVTIVERKRTVHKTRPTKG